MDQEVTFHCPQSGTSLMATFSLVWEYFIPSVGMFCSQRGNNEIVVRNLVDSRNVSIGKVTTLYDNSKIHFYTPKRRKKHETLAFLK